MKKTFSTIIAGTFMALIFCHAGYADSDHLSLPNGRLSPPREKFMGAPSAAPFLEKGDIAFLPLPFRFMDKARRNPGDRSVFPLFSAFLFMKEGMVEKAPMRPGYSDYSGTRTEQSAMSRVRRVLDSNQLTSEEYMGFPLNRDVGKAKRWKLSLDVGIALETDSNLSHYAGNSLGDVPVFQSEPGGQETDLLDQIRNGAPFVGLGLSCRF